MKTEHSNSLQIQISHTHTFLIITLRRLNQTIFSAFWVGFLAFQSGLLVRNWAAEHYENIQIVFGKIFNFKNIF